MILIFNQENDDTLVQSILLGGHGMIWVRQHTRLKDGCEILRVHAILIRLSSENSKKIKDVEEQLSVQGRQLGDEPLVPLDSSLFIEVVDELRTFQVANSLFRCASEGVAELFVEIERNNRFGEVVEISP